MEKVKVTKDQAEMLEFKLRNNEKTQLIKERLNGEWTNEKFILNQLEADDLIKALYIGYEVEQTKEEKLLQAYETAIEAEENTWSRGYLAGIEKTLNTLGIEIKGINKK